MKKLIVVFTFFLFTGCAGLIPAQEEDKWLQAQITTPPEINVSGSYYDQLNPPPNFWQSAVISLMNSYYEGWGIANLQQDKSQVYGSLSSYYTIKGAVSGKTVYLLIIYRGKVKYIAQLISDKDGKLIGTYFEDVDMQIGYPMVLAPVPRDSGPAAGSTGQTISTGTGFTISNQGFIATANHVVDNAKVIKVHFGSTAMEAKIYQSDPMNDIAILKVEKPTPIYLPIAPMRSAKTGDRVFTVGYPLSSILGQEIKYTEGVISSLSGLQDAASFFQITVPVQPGNSGGALVNEKGQVVGIISSSAAIMPFLKESGTLPQNVNWAVKSDYIRPLLDLPEDQQKSLSREATIEKAKQATVMIEAVSQ
jgi:S1-C subfamily serine protease